MTIDIPKIGFGTFPLKDEECENAVFNAIKSGYRLIDSAYAYQNEIPVGKAIRKAVEKGIVKREDIMVTTKLCHHNPIGYENTINAVKESLSRLGLNYIDLYLIHWPNVTEGDKWKKLNAETWKAMEELQEQGLLKQIGVSNFGIHHLEELFKTAKIKPVVNQIELSPIWQQREIVNFCKQNGILLEAYSPFSCGTVFEKEIVNSLSQKYNKTSGQIVLRWSIQKGFIPLPRTTSIEEMRQNLQIFDFELHEEDIKKLDDLLSNPTCPTPDTMRMILEAEERLHNPPKVTKETIAIFGCIPLLKIKHFENRWKYYLFGFIPFLEKRILSDELAKIYLFSLIPLIKIKMIKDRNIRNPFLPQY